MKFTISSRTEGDKLLRAIENWVDGNSYLINKKVEYRSRYGVVHLLARGLDEKTTNELREHLQKNNIKSAAVQEGRISPFFTLLRLSTISSGLGLCMALLFWLFTLTSMVLNIVANSNVLSSILGFLLLSALYLIFVFAVSRQLPLIVPSKEAT